MIGLIAVTASGRAAADRLAQAWPGRVQIYHGPARKALPRAWTQCGELVCFLAVGATVRIIAPLLDSKWTDPAVVCVDESSRHAVAVVGGHAAGANALAARVAEVLGADPVITTATDVVGVPGLDMLGWPAEGAIGVVSRAMLDGEPVRLVADAVWPLPPLPDTVGATGEYRVVISDRVSPIDRQTAVLRPPSLVVGVAAKRGVNAGEILALIDASLIQEGLSPASVSALACDEAATEEPGVAEAARRRGWRLTSCPPDLLAAAGRAAPGLAGAAEAAALAGADVLVGGARSSASTAVALARVRPRGRLAVVGLGPGPRDLLTPRAAEEIRRSSVVVGADRDLAEIRDLLRPGARAMSGGASDDEESRVALAVEQARQGKAVALIGAGDAGGYAVAGPALGLAASDIDIEAVPGVGPQLAAVALLGAPPGQDHAVISLCDPRTPWDAVERRVRAAADGDFVVAFHHPRGPGQDWQLAAALGILARRRPADTPVAVLRQSESSQEQVETTTLAAFDPQTVDMRGIVIVGATGTTLVGGRMVADPAAAADGEAVPSRRHRK